MKPTVVKLGGSLIEHVALERLLAVAELHAAVVAPGGGRFADAVRDAQDGVGFSDAAAHQMAILAMEQVAHLLHDRAPGFLTCASLADFEAARGRPALWLPSRMASAAPLPASWDVTSDSLALWLACALGARKFVLVKAGEAPRASSPADWARAGLVDPQFPRLAEAFAGEIVCVGRASPEELAAVLSAPVSVAA